MERAERAQPMAAVTSLARRRGVVHEDKLPWPTRGYRFGDWLNHAGRMFRCCDKCLQMRLLRGVCREASSCPSRPVTAGRRGFESRRSRRKYPAIGTFCCLTRRGRPPASARPALIPQQAKKEACLQEFSPPAGRNGRCHPARLSPGPPETGEIGKGRCLVRDRKGLSRDEHLPVSSHSGDRM
jgi:hypothetical protein